MANTPSCSASGAIVGIASGILAAVVLTITAAVTLSEATDG